MLRTTPQFLTITPRKTANPQRPRPSSSQPANTAYLGTARLETARPGTGTWRRNPAHRTGARAACPLTARGGSRVGRIRSAAVSNARRREEGDAVVSLTSDNKAIGAAPSEPFGREGVTTVGHCCSSESMRRIDSFLDSSPNGRKTLSCDPRDFHHGLLTTRRLRQNRSESGRGRDIGRPTPPAQIRT